MLAADLGDSVVFLGARDRQFVAEAMRHAKVFCMPSMPSKLGDNEGFGMVYLEAQLAGTPVVAFDQGPSREALSPENSRNLAAPGSIDDLSSKLAVAMKQSSSASDVAIEYVLRNFRLNDRSRCLLESYKEAMLSGWHYD